jgi:cyclopropane fatty-acyl-phospholipid synthase-like methyltransferase
VSRNIFDGYKIFNIDSSSLRSENFYQDLMTERQTYWNERKILIKDDDDAQCTLCKGKNNHLYLEYQGYKLFECQECEAIFANIMFDERYNQLVYDNSLYEENNKREILDTYEYRKEKFGKDRLNYIINKCQFTPNKKLLDLGCGSGYFLKYLTEKNYKCKGLELTQYLVDICKEKNLNVSNSSLENEPNLEYDIITMFDVLEHITTPIDFLKIANKKIVKSGYILAFVPNIHSFAFHFQKGEQPLLAPYEHVIFYNLNSLNYLAEATGFTIESIDYYGLDIVDYLSMKGFKDQTNYNEKLSEIIPYLQALIDSEKMSNHIRIIFKKV